MLQAMMDTFEHLRRGMENHGSHQMDIFNAPAGAGKPPMQSLPQPMPEQQSTSPFGFGGTGASIGTWGQRRY